jgi:predicted TIM-barrel fold metal-dependent hydrolase
MLRVVDAHHHLWDLSANYYPWLMDAEPIPFRYGDYAAIRRDYLPANYRSDWGSVTVEQSVHVEAEWDRSRPVEETRWLEGVAASEGLPSAIVAWAMLDAPDAAATLADHARSPLVRGVRYKPTAAGAARDAARGAPGSMDDPAFREGYARLAAHGMSFDLQTPWWHLDAAAALARDFPSTTIILNHTGLPSDRSAEGLAAWRAAMERLAAAPNTAVKISGLGRPGMPWTLDANAPVISDAIAIFGADRAMFASNYPVDKLAGDFTTIWRGFADAIADLPTRDQAALLRDNARRIYRI